jgi:hypothetical protein
MNQIQLFDLPASSKPTRAPRAARPAPAPAPVVLPAEPLPEPRAQRLAALTREITATQRARYLGEQAARPGPALDDATLARLSAQGVTVVASYLARDGDASGAGTALYALEGRFTPNGQATILTKTHGGVQALLVTMEGRANA